MNKVSFTECPVMTATFEAHQYAVRQRQLYDDGILHIDDLEHRISVNVDALAEKHELQPAEIRSLSASARMTARLGEISSPRD